MKIQNIKEYTDWEMGIHEIIKNTFFNKDLLVMDESNLGQIAIKDLSSIESETMRTKLWDNSLRSFAEILRKLPNLMYHHNDRVSKNKFIYGNNCFISEAEIIYEDGTITVRFKCIYGHTFDGQRELYPIEFVQRLISACENGDLWIIPTDHCIDKFDVWFHGSSVADRVLKELYKINEECMDKYKVWCNFYKQYDDSGLVKMKFGRKEPSTFGSYSYTDLLVNGVYTLENATFIKNYAGGLNALEYFKLLSDNEKDDTKLKKLGWNPDIPITLPNIKSESDKTKKRMITPLVTPIVKQDKETKAIWIIDILDRSGTICINTLIGFIDHKDEYYFAFNNDNLLERVLPQNYITDDTIVNKYFILAKINKWNRLKNKLDQITSHMKYSNFHYDEFANYCRFKQYDFNGNARILCFTQFLQYLFITANRKEGETYADVGFDSLSKFAIPQIYLLNNDSIKYHNSDDKK